MGLFGNEAAARQYLEHRIPPKESAKEIDFSRFKERLFDIPKDIGPGHHEFKGAHGYTVSFDLTRAIRAHLEDAHMVYRNSYEPDNSGAVTGSFEPIYSIENLKISTPHFSSESAVVGRPTTILWLPNLQSVNPELSHNFSAIDKGELFLIGEVGFFSRPADLFSLFHESGHVATRTPDELVAERNSVKRSYSSAGYKTEPIKEAALELQRERDADAWLLLKTRKLFPDLGIPTTSVKDYIHHAQLKTYHDSTREWLEEHDANLKQNSTDLP